MTDVFWPAINTVVQNTGCGSKRDMPIAVDPGGTRLPSLTSRPMSLRSLCVHEPVGLCGGTNATRPDLLQGGGPFCEALAFRIGVEALTM